MKKIWIVQVLTFIAIMASIFNSGIPLFALILFIINCAQTEVVSNNAKKQESENYYNLKMQEADQLSLMFMQ